MAADLTTMIFADAWERIFAVWQPLPERQALIYNRLNITEV